MSKATTQSSTSQENNLVQEYLLKRKNIRISIDRHFSDICNFCSIKNDNTLIDGDRCNNCGHAH